jgi:succinate-semialdehyde dehydrogenase/glutarate-semialdehyde dehydrogenase
MQLNDLPFFASRLINGRWRDASSKETLAVTNPANGQQLGSVPKMGAAETREAIDAAAGALPAWRALTPKNAPYPAPLV